MSEAVLAKASVRRVSAALAVAGSTAQVVALADSAHTAQQAADALGCPVGAIVKSLVFLLDESPVMALVAGDRRCDTATLPTVFGILGAKVGRADAEVVRSATGFAIGGVAPIGHPAPLAIVIDASLGRFSRMYAAAGHPHCVFATSLEELARLTGATISPMIGVAQSDVDASLT